MYATVWKLRREFLNRFVIHASLLRGETRFGVFDSDVYENYRMLRWNWQSPVVICAFCLRITWGFEESSLIYINSSGAASKSIKLQYVWKYPLYQELGGSIFHWYEAVRH